MDQLSFINLSGKRITDEHIKVLCSHLDKTKEIIITIQDSSITNKGLIYIFEYLMSLNHEDIKPKFNFYQHTNLDVIIVHLLSNISTWRKRCLNEIPSLQRLLEKCKSKNKALY